MTGAGDRAGWNGRLAAAPGGGSAPDEAAFRALLAEVRGAVGPLLEARGRVAPGAGDHEAVRALVDEHVGAHERRAVALGVPGLADPPAVARRLFGFVCGGGPLDALLRDPEVEEVIVNGTRVLAVRNGRKEEVADAGFADEAEVVELVRRLVGPLGKRLDESSPMVEARLPDGARLFAVIAPAASHWCSVNVRKHVLRARTLEDLVALGSVPPAAADFLRAAVQARASILVSGGTASGKTTLINALGSAIASGSERLVVCEDTPELQLPFTLRDCVALQVREDNVEGEGRITLRDLVRAALRMRPDRIILGESRGAEAYDVLQALNSGHEGGMTSVHANTAREALTKLVTMAAQAPEHLGVPVLTRMVAQTVDLVCHVAKDPRTGRRRLAQIAELAGQEGDEVLTNDLWALDAPPGAGPGGARLGWTGIPPRCLARMAQWGVPYALPPAPGWAE